MCQVNVGRVKINKEDHTNQVKVMWVENGNSDRSRERDSLRLLLLMEKREDLKSILPFLPLSLRSSSLFWPPPVSEALNDLSKGPNHSKIDSGEVLFIVISDIRKSLSLPTFSIDTSASHGFALFFDDVNFFFP